MYKSHTGSALISALTLLMIIMIVINSVNQHIHGAIQNSVLLTEHLNLYYQAQTRLHQTLKLVESQTGVDLMKLQLPHTIISQQYPYLHQNEERLEHNDYDILMIDKGKSQTVFLHTHVRLLEHKIKIIAQYMHYSSAIL